MCENHNNSDNSVHREALSEEQIAANALRKSQLNRIGSYFLVMAVFVSVGIAISRWNDKKQWWVGALVGVALTFIYWRAMQGEWFPTIPDKKFREGGVAPGGVRSVRSVSTITPINNTTPLSKYVVCATPGADGGYIHTSLAENCGKCAAHTKCFS